MDKDTPESLLQFMDSATSSLKAALEQPLGKKNNVNDYMQKYMLTYSPPTRERRRQKCPSRRRQRGQKHCHQPSTGHWMNDGPSQANFLQDILGCTPQTGGSSRPTQWEDDLQWSPNMTRGISDDSPNNSPHFGAQASGDFHQIDPNCDLQYGPRKAQDMNSSIPHSSRERARILEDLVNTMPIGCHLPPPMPIASTSHHMPKERDSVSQRMMPMLLGIPGGDDTFLQSGKQTGTSMHEALFHQQKINSPCIRKTQVSSRHQISKQHIKPNCGNVYQNISSSRSSLSCGSQAKFTNEQDQESLIGLIAKRAAACSDHQRNPDSSPASMELLSELVTVLDKTKTLDLLSANFKYQNVRNDESSADTKFLNKDYPGQVSNVYENNGISQKQVESKASTGSTWQENRGPAERRMRFSNKSTSFDLACALEDTHLDNSESQHKIRRCEESKLLSIGNNNLKRNSASMEALHIDTGSNEDVGNAKTSKKNSANVSWNSKVHNLIKLHERNSMPNLYSNKPRHSHVLIKTVPENFLLSSSTERVNTMGSTEIGQRSHSNDFPIRTATVARACPSNVQSGVNSFGCGEEQRMNMTSGIAQEYSPPFLDNMYSHSIGSLNPATDQGCVDHMNITSERYVDKSVVLLQTQAFDTGIRRNTTGPLCQENVNDLMNMSVSSPKRHSSASVRSNPAPASEIYNVDNQDHTAFQGYPQNSMSSTQTHEYGIVTTSESYNANTYNNRVGMSLQDPNFDFDKNMPVSLSLIHNSDLQNTSLVDTRAYSASSTSLVDTRAYSTSLMDTIAYSTSSTSPVDTRAYHTSSTPLVDTRAYSTSSTDPLPVTMYTEARCSPTDTRKVHHCNLNADDTLSNNSTMSGHSAENVQLYKLAQTNSLHLGTNNSSLPSPAINEEHFQAEMSCNNHPQDHSNRLNEISDHLVSSFSDSGSAMNMIQSNSDASKSLSHLVDQRRFTNKAQVSNSKPTGEKSGLFEQFTMTSEQTNINRPCTANPQTSSDMYRMSEKNASTQLAHQSQFEVTNGGSQLPSADSTVSTFSAHDPEHHFRTETSYSDSTQFVADDSVFCPNNTYHQTAQYNPTCCQDKMADDDEADEEYGSSEEEGIQDYPTRGHVTPCSSDPSTLKLPSFTSTFL